MKSKSPFQGSVKPTMVQPKIEAVPLSVELNKKQMKGVSKFLFSIFQVIIVAALVLGFVAYLFGNLSPKAKEEILDLKKKIQVLPD